MQLGGGGLQFTAAVASLVEKLAGAAQEFVDFSKSGAELVFFELQQPLASLASVALGCEVGGLLLELEILGFALQLFCGSGFDLGRRACTRSLISPNRESMRPSTAVAERCRSSSAATRATR